MSDNNTITDIEKLKDMLTSPNVKHREEAYSRMTEQAQQAYAEVMAQIQDLICQLLGYAPTKKQVAKHMTSDQKPSGREIIYWKGEAILKLSPIKVRKVPMRLVDEDPKYKFGREYEILKDDPDGYKFRNPDDNYVANNYPDRDGDDPKLISP